MFVNARYRVVQDVFDGNETCAISADTRAAPAACATIKRDPIDPKSPRYNEETF
jgi:hypothetical protein